MSFTCAMHSLSYANIDISADGMNDAVLNFHVISAFLSEKMHFF